MFIQKKMGGQANVMEKSKEELDALKEEVETLNKKLSELPLSICSSQYYRWQDVYCEKRMPRKKRSVQQSRVDAPSDTVSGAYFIVFMLLEFTKKS